MQEPLEVKMARLEEGMVNLRGDFRAHTTRMEAIMAPIVTKVDSHGSKIERHDAHFDWLKGSALLVLTWLSGLSIKLWKGGP